MKKTLVNHGGYIQWKYVLRNVEDVEAYSKRESSLVVSHFEGMLHKKDGDTLTTHQQYIKLVAENNHESIIVSTDRIVRNKLVNMLKAVQAGHVLVVNEAGGYCYWNDKEMSLVEETEENIKIAKEASDAGYDIEVNIVDSKVLVLENQSEIPTAVKDLVENKLKVSKYSYIKNIRFAENSLPVHIHDAIIHGCNTIVAETTMANIKQIEKLAYLLDKLPPMHIYLKTHSDFKEELLKILGKEKATSLLSKHAVVIFE